MSASTRDDTVEDPRHLAAADIYWVSGSTAKSEDVPLDAPSTLKPVGGNGGDVDAKREPKRKRGRRGDHKIRKPFAEASWEERFVAREEAFRKGEAEEATIRIPHDASGRLNPRGPLAMYMPPAPRHTQVPDTTMQYMSADSDTRDGSDNESHHEGSECSGSSSPPHPVLYTREELLHLTAEELIDIIMTLQEPHRGRARHAKRPRASSS
jgi:hypothetical protein